MIKIHRLNFNSIILFGDIHTLDIAAANEIMEGILKIEGELDHQATMQRFKQITDNHILVCGYASIMGDQLPKFVTSLLQTLNLEFKNEVLPENSVKMLSEFLPYESKRKGCICGGRTNDTETIDTHVQYLSHVFNTFPGLTTFSSCEGHINQQHEATYYILFNIDTFENLQIFTKAIDSALEETWNVYEDFAKQSIRCSLLFDYGHWPNRTGVYFELRINYSHIVQEQLWEAMDYLAAVLEKQTQ